MCFFGGASTFVFSIISGPNQDALWLELCRDLWSRKVQRYRLTKQRQSELQGSAPGTADGVFLGPDLGF
jgi:hypothetical protein